MFEKQKFTDRQIEKYFNSALRDFKIAVNFFENGEIGRAERYLERAIKKTNTESRQKIPVELRTKTLDYRKVVTF